MPCPDLYVLPFGLLSLCLEECYPKLCWGTILHNCLLLEYADQIDVTAARHVPLDPNKTPREPAAAINTGFLGAGAYATRVLVPAFAKTPSTLQVICSLTGVSSIQAGRKHGIAAATTDPQTILDDEGINLVVVSTRHDTHADYVCRALAAGKHVFVEKLLALNTEELVRIRQAYADAAADGSPRALMVGFNRRFAPQVIALQELLAARTEPASFIMTVNAGFIPPDHWTQDPAVGGGRIVGEACHFVDLLRHLTGSPIVAVKASCLRGKPAKVPADSVSATLAFENGAVGTIHYFSNGNKAIHKERLEVFCGGGIIQLDNFRRMKGFGWPGFSRMNLRRQDKGNHACVHAFVESLTAGTDVPIPFDEIVEVHEATFEIAAAVA